MGLFVVLALRLLIPLTIFRWPLGGALLSIIADIFDMNIFSALGWYPLEPGDYQIFDKALDTYYLTFEFIVALRWKEVFARRTASALFLFRLGGFIIFGLTGKQYLLFFFPNVFENFYLLVAAIKKFFPKADLNKKRMVLALAAAAFFPKMLHEYYLHMRHLDFNLFALGIFSDKRGTQFFSERN
jgi:hypothetical protein